jgi:4-hydroxybenzoate polyprenyltransferase
MTFPWKALVVILLVGIFVSVILGWWWAPLLLPFAGLAIGYRAGVKRRREQDRGVDQ